MQAILNRVTVLHSFVISSPELPSRWVILLLSAADAIDWLFFILRKEENLFFSQKNFTAHGLKMSPKAEFTLSWFIIPNGILGSKSKLGGLYVTFSSQGHIGTGPRFCHLWDSNLVQKHDLELCLMINSFYYEGKSSSISSKQKWGNYKLNFYKHGHNTTFHKPKNRLKMAASFTSGSGGFGKIISWEWC